MAAIDRLLSYYNASAYSITLNPGGLLSDGHRYNFIPIVQDIAEVAQSLIGTTTEGTRLATFYNGLDYHAVYQPGGFGNGGHKVNYIPAIRDVATVADIIGAHGAAQSRLASYYTGTTYNAITNPGGMARTGHRINFEPSLADLVTVGFAIASIVPGVAHGESHAISTASAVSAGLASAGHAIATASAAGTGIAIHNVFGVIAAIGSAAGSSSGSGAGTGHATATATAAAIGASTVAGAGTSNASASASGSGSTAGASMFDPNIFDPNIFDTV